MILPSHSSFDQALVSRVEFHFFKSWLRVEHGYHCFENTNFILAPINQNWVLHRLDS